MKKNNHIPHFLFPCSFFHSSLFLLFSFFFFLLLSSCSQQKNRWLNRAYHGTTTRYNIYFNGNESFKEGVFSIESAYKDDYTKILPVFVYGDENTAKSAYPQMDNAIKKASKSVQRHSMYIKEVEYNEWIDDCYMLVGKSEFYKREYPKAQSTFEYVARDFKHKEIKHEAMLWMVRTYLETKDFNNAGKFLDLVTSDKIATEKGIAHLIKPEPAKIDSVKKDQTETKEEAKEKKTTASKSGKSGKNSKSGKNKKGSSNKNKKSSTSKKSSATEQKKKELVENHIFPSRLKADYHAVYADYYIRQENYQLAAAELKNCLANTKKKKRKVRLCYILAQLYQKTGNYEMATRYYSQVLKMRPSYEMEFYAQINRAMAFDVGAGNSAEIKKQLMQMMKDEKNKEFFDQIYYALADLELKEGNEPKGIDYLKTSTEKSISNNNQKGLSFLRLADIYFEKKQYQPAQSYYDSTINFLNKDRADYPVVLAKRNSLTKLVKNMLIIEKEDSLQRLAGLSEKERNKIIDEMIQKAVEEEELKKQEEQQSALMPVNKPQAQGATSGGEWYFYNPGTLGFGFSEFKKIWGDRPLEDNWRRKNKSLASADFDANDLVQLEEKDTGKVNLKDRNHYLKNIPFEKEKMNRSHNKMIEAYYDLGLVYREQFEDNEQSQKTFETLISKYDTCRYVLPSYYQLYKIFLEERNNEKAEFYKNKILKEYPNSEYAKILLDPDYFREIAREKSQAEEYYKNTYMLYNDRQYAVVIANCLSSDSLYPKNFLAPKFLFLKALAIGKTSPVTEIGTRDYNNFKIALIEVTEKYPKDEVAEEAKKIIALMEKKQSDNTFQTVDSTISLYQFKPEAKHSCLLIVPVSEDVNKIKIAISDFNAKYFSLSKLSVSDALLDSKKQMISVKFFDEIPAAMNYYRAFKGDNEFLKDIHAKGFTLFVISYENFAVFYNQKNVEDYLSFFTKNYPAE